MTRPAGCRIDEEGLEAFRHAILTLHLPEWKSSTQLKFMLIIIQLQFQTNSSFMVIIFIERDENVYYYKKSEMNDYC